MEAALRWATADLLFLLRQWETQGDVITLPNGTTCFAEPNAAKTILANDGDNLVEHSDFFHLRHGIFGPRAAQLEIAKSTKHFLRAALPDLRAAMPAIVHERLSGDKEWPDEGNRILEAAVGRLLLDHPLVGEIVTKSVLADARRRRSTLDRLRFRRRATRVLIAEVLARRRSTREPCDLLDVVVAGAGADAAPGEVVEVFLSFVFALVGSVGFALGWSVLLLGTNPRTDAPSSWVVREALRLWPVAWFFGRTPAHVHHVSGVALTPRHDVVVCAPLVHRHPAHWERRHEFVPERWAHTGHRAYLPFGWGPHSCTGATVATELAACALDTIRALRPTVHPHGTIRPSAAALAPPEFTLRATATGVP